jgi:alkanesulfonate monooxygenase SsuD/methylene tetrahydromethanopterin reductase-like flavin-dependent oxidoreductase (luciferase family)
MSGLRAGDGAGAPRLGILLSFQARPDAGVAWERSYREGLELAAEADRLGVDDVWLTEHHGEEDGYCPSPVVAAAAVAAATRQVRIALGVALAPLHGHPLRLAEDLAVVDNLSGGRLEVGLGQGYRPGEFEAFGLPYGRRTRAFEEALDVLEWAWRGERFDHEGDVYRVRGGRLRPAPVRPGAPPLWLGAAAPASRARAVRRRAGLVIAMLTDHGHTERQFAAFDREAASAGLGPLPHALMREVVVADTAGDAARAARPHLEYVYRVTYPPELTGLTVRDARTGERRPVRADDPEFLSDDFLRERFVVGDVEHCVARLADQARAMRLDRLVFRPQFPGQPLAEAVATVERMVGEVMPAVRERLAGVTGR